MSQKKCPACHYVFLKKKDYIEHVTYSSCSEKLKDFLVLCPHCNKQFSNEDGLSFHLMRNETCSNKQDTAFDMLNRLPSSRSNGNIGGDSKRLKSTTDDDEGNLIVTDSFHIEQGVIVHCNNGNDNQRQFRGNSGSRNNIFIPLSQIQCGGDDTRPFFPIETLHHTQVWRKISAIEPNMYQQANKHQFLSENLRTVDIKNRGSLLESPMVMENLVDPGITHDGDTHQFEVDDEYSSVSSFNEQDSDNDESSDEDNDFDNNDVWDMADKTVMAETIAVQKHQSRLLFSNEIIALTDLYSMLNRRGIPAHLFDTLTQWAWKNRNLLTKMSEPPMKRKKYLKHIRMAVRGTREAVKEYEPKRNLITLSSGRQVYVTTIGFKNMITDMLSNNMLMQSKNLLWNDELGTTLSEVNTGEWWSSAAEMECITESEVLWPLIMFIDGMKISNMGTLRLEPITFTFSRFKRHIRNQENAWRTAAFIEEVHQRRGEEKISAKDKLQDYHDILNFIFSDLSTLQKSGITWSFPDQCGELSNRKVVLKLPIQLIIGDCEGHDKLCGRYKSHGQHVRGLCRDCDVPTTQADNVDWKCSFRTASQLQGYTIDQLTAISIYDIFNALYSISFGGTSRGFFAALLAENLHVLESGLFPVMFDGIWSSVSQKGKDYLHNAAQFFVNIHKSIEQVFKGLPPINAFRNGMTSEKSGGAMLLDASDKHGRIFLLYCFLTCAPVVNYLCTHEKRGESEYNLTYWKGILKMLEMALSFEAWVCKKEHEYKEVVGDDG
jgi:hypothetical protein